MIPEERHRQLEIETVDMQLLNRAHVRQGRRQRRRGDDAVADAGGHHGDVFLWRAVELEPNGELLANGCEASSERVAEPAAVGIQNPRPAFQVGHADGGVLGRLRAARRDDHERFAANRIEPAWDVGRPPGRHQQHGAVEFAAREASIQSRTPAGTHHEIRVAQRRHRLDESRILKVPHQAAGDPDAQRLPRAANRPVGQTIGVAQDLSRRLKDTHADGRRPQRLRAAIDKLRADLVLENLQHACHRWLRATDAPGGGAEAAFFENPHERTKAIEVHGAFIVIDAGSGNAPPRTRTLALNPRRRHLHTDAFPRSAEVRTMRIMLRLFTLCMVTLASAILVPVAAAQTLKVPADSPRWDLQGQAAVADYQGRTCLKVDSGGAALKDFAMRDAVIDVDVLTPASRGFFGIQFRLDDDGANGEWIYLRQHKSGRPDAMQYTPVLNTGLNWQLYNGPGFTAAIDIPRSEWFHLRLEVVGAQAKFYVKDMDRPALVMSDLKSGIERGQVALVVLTGATYFSNFEVRSLPDAGWVRPSRSMPPGTLTKWSLSPSFDALARDLEHPLSTGETAAIHWQTVEAEWPGIVPINRYRESPHPRVTFQSDFSTRLDPQPGTRVVYARTTIDADRDQIRKLSLGYSDEVSIFLNGRILFRGRSAQSFRDPDFLGIVSADNDAVFLPLKKGSNELVLAVTEFGGGWGFICRLSDVTN
jgi:hypothetical protein